MPYRNIVLIDDDEDDQEIFCEALKHISPAVKCTTFFDGSEALVKLSKKKIVPDVIFLDLNMPIMNGQQFLALIKKNVDLQTIPVIIFTTSSNVSTIQVVKDLGAHDFITKPSSIDDLVNLLKRVFS